MRRIRVLQTLFLGAVCSLGAVGAAGEEGALADLEFIAGNWVGSMGEATIEEVWSAPSGDNMIGMFRLVKGGKAVFYEFQAIEATDQGPRLSLRHFNPSLIGWEEKEEALRLPLSELEPGRAIFGEPGGETRLEYHRSAPDALSITLHKFENGKKSRSKFDYRLANGNEPPRKAVRSSPGASPEG